MEALHLWPAIFLSEISLIVFNFKLWEDHCIFGYGNDSKCYYRWLDVSSFGSKLIAFICFPVSKQSTCNLICTSVWKQKSRGILLANIGPLKE